MGNDFPIRRFEDLAQVLVSEIPRVGHAGEGKDEVEVSGHITLEVLVCSQEEMA